MQGKSCDSEKVFAAGITPLTLLSTNPLFFGRLRPFPTGRNLAAPMMAVLRLRAPEAVLI
jgi:hypothetical protein